MSPEEIDTWLRSNHKNRAWLADKLAVSYHTARGWFSGGRPIPKLKLKKIEELKILLEQEEQAKASAVNERLRVVGTTFSDEEISLMEKAAHGTPLDIFFRECVLDMTRRINEEDKVEE